MGVVFRATDLELCREVAVKLLVDAGVSTQERERLLREARSAAALNHPHVVAVHDTGSHDGTPFLVMEYVDGPSLRAEPPSDLAEIVRLACQICDALEHAHARAVVHRDLKPENVLLAGPPGARAVKLVDLGLAVAAGASQRLSEAGVIVGTVSFMAPEQALGQTVDGRADLYALGVMLYELTTGRLPFTGAQPLEIVSQHVLAPVVPPRAVRADLPPGLDAVIVRLLAKEPEGRFASAADTRDALRAALTVPVTSGDDAGAAFALLDVLSRGRLVARGQELAHASELWRRTCGGTGHCVLISGEPGAGKTRLAREVLVQIALDGATVWTGACYEFEASTPYLPFVEAIRKWVREQPDGDRLRTALGEGAVQLARLVPEIATRLGPFPERTALPAHEERLLFFDAVAEVLRAQARATTVAVYIDDLHWADSGSLWLLGHLLRALREERVFFLASYREVELDRTHPLAKALVDWNRERLATRIALRRFTLDETRAQLGALLGEEVSLEFASAVHRETEGNPFFVEEVLKALIEQGTVRRASGRWKRDETTQLIVPQSVKEAIGHRLDAISQGCNDTLRLAATLGKTFEFDELLSVAQDIGEDALLDALDEAVTAQLLVAGRGESFAFTHDKIREVLYEELNPIRRRRLHRRIAEGLEARLATRPVSSERLAHHFIEAGDHERGLTWARRAGDDACSLFAYDEALAYYARAAECAETLRRVEEQVALEETMAGVCFASGNWIAALEHCEAGLAMAEDPVARARLQGLAASSFTTVGDPRAIEYADAALAVLDPDVHRVDYARALTEKARFHHLRGHHRKAIDGLREAAALLEPRSSDLPLTALHSSALTQCLGYIAGAYQNLGLFADADRWAAQVMDLGVAHNIPLAQAVGLEFLGENAISSGEWRSGLEYAELEWNIATRVHSRERQAWSRFVAGWCLFFLDDCDAALREIDTGLQLCEVIGESRLATFIELVRVQVWAAQGRHDEALAEVQRIHDAVKDSHATQLIGLLYYAFASVRCARREWSDAVEMGEKAWAAVADRDTRIPPMYAGPPLITALRALGRHDEAAAWLDRYAALIAEIQSPHFARVVDTLRADAR